MRLFIIGLTMALTTSAPLVATAQGSGAPVSTQPLASGEVLLEVNALGLVTTRADRATLTFNITGAGESEAAARADAQRNIAEVRALLRAQGVAEADIRVQPVSAYADASLAEANVMTYDVSENMAMPVATPSATANAQAEIVIRNVDRVPAIQTALSERGIYTLGGGAYALNDDSVPRRQARVQALQKARADAEAYAASLNMRVARIVRVTERLGLDLLGLAATESQLVTQLFMSGMARSGAAEVPTVVAVGVDFALVAR
ncbi:MAG TPA: SIMPL domain-containing protein [Allosphingosinicella sp.]|nr:SIMPL domain-containing protein [Allosphingosinicella sp.]